MSVHGSGIGFIPETSHCDALVKFNEICLKGLASTPEHRKERTEASENGENVGTMILDATASPSNIRFPQDFSLLNEAREKTDCMIDLLHKQIREKLHPRTYRECCTMPI